MTDKISGRIVDVVGKRIFPGQITLRSGKIAAVEETRDGGNAPLVLPGLVDGHVHIESSLLVPSQFARLAVTQGVTAALADPHEIANVLGIEGVRFMITDGRRVPFKFYFGAPSCVPATGYETTGGRISIEDVKELLQDREIKYLSEMMNFPGVINKDPEVWGKIGIARSMGKPIDGHAPGLVGEALAAYLAAGISTDHECLTLGEAKEKISRGMKIFIRDGSAARDLEKFSPLIQISPESVMLCSDDIHPDDLLQGYLNRTCRKAIALGGDPLAVIRAATVNPARHYGLEVGLLQVGDDADLIVIDSWESFRVLKTYIKGELVALEGKSLIDPPPIEPLNNFIRSSLEIDDFRIPEKKGLAQVIAAQDGDLWTGRLLVRPKVTAGHVEADPAEDLLKVAVVNRYREAPPAVALITNFGLKRGAIASSVAHDSHNIVAVGTNDRDLSRAVNLIIESKGGLAAVAGEMVDFLPLPVGGIMTDQDAYLTAAAYARINRTAQELGSTLKAPFMTLSFLALLVIPRLKLSDLGLFDSEEMRFVDLFVTDERGDSR